MFLWAGRSIEGRHVWDLYFPKVGSIQYLRSQRRDYWCEIFMEATPVVLIPRHSDGTEGTSRSRELCLFSFFPPLIYQRLNAFGCPLLFAFQVGTGISRGGFRFIISLVSRVEAWMGPGSFPPFVLRLLEWEVLEFPS